MTLEQWQQSEELLKSWRETWREPHMQMGLDVLRNAVMDATVHLNGQADALTAAAMRDSAREGAKLMLRIIDGMSTGKSDQAPTVPMARSLVPEDDEPPAISHPKKNKS